jgi:hypothetical protein
MVGYHLDFRPGFQAQSVIPCDGAGRDRDFHLLSRLYAGRGHEDEYAEEIAAMVYQDRDDAGGAVHDRNC